MKAMVIDDSKAMRMILAKILRELGFEVFEAENGKAALNKLSEIGAADLALVDWNMPEMNGFEFVKAVRANPRHQDLVLMMVTTETEMENINEAMLAGANEYVMKPFTREIIADKLELLGLQN